MKSTRELPTRLARLSLLLAALLQIAAAVVGPSVHLASLQSAAVDAAPAAAPADEDGSGGQPVPHDELSCIFCHSLPVAIGDPAPSLVLSPELRGPAHAADDRNRPDRSSRYLPPARAPPAA